MENKTIVRDSNMELFRIVAMITVMLFHLVGEMDLMTRTNGSSLKIDTSIILWFTSATFVCVNMFVLLSGWYGIRTRWEKLRSFIFQVLFFSVSIYPVMCLVDRNTII